MNNIRKSLSFTADQLELISGILCGYDSTMYTADQCDAIDKIINRFDKAAGKIDTAIETAASTVLNDIKIEKHSVALAVA